MQRLGMVGVCAAILVALCLTYSVSYAGPAMHYQGSTAANGFAHFRLKMYIDGDFKDATTPRLAGEWYADFTGDVSSSILFNELTFRVFRQSFGAMETTYVTASMVIDGFDFRAQSVGPLVTSLVDIDGDIDVFRTEANLHGELGQFETFWLTGTLTLTGQSETVIKEFEVPFRPQTTFGLGNGVFFHTIDLRQTHNMPGEVLLAADHSGAFEVEDMPTIVANEIVEGRNVEIRATFEPWGLVYIQAAALGVPLGDVNLDGEVNGLDVDPFVDVLLSGPYQTEADMNDDQIVNGLDVDLFVAAVVGGGTQPVPEPSTLLLALVVLSVFGGWRKWKTSGRLLDSGRSQGGCIVMIRAAVCPVIMVQLFGSIQPVHAMNWEVTQLTDNDYDKSDVRVSGSSVVWVSNDGNDLEIMLYDGETITQLTDNDYMDTSPVLSGSNVAWLGAEGGNDMEVFLYDGETTRQITDNNYLEGSIGMSGSNLVWDGKSSDGWEIYLYDGHSVTQLTDNEHDSRTPGIDGTDVVWSEVRGNDSENFLYDGTTITQISSDDRADAAPHISGSQVVWSSDSEILLYDAGTTIQLTNNDYEDEAPVIDGSTVAWTGKEGNDDKEIFLYDGSATLQLTNNNYEDDGAYVQGSSVVWKGVEGGNDSEIFIYDGSRVTQLTDNDSRDWAPQVSDSNVVWLGHDGNNFEIFLATPILPGDMNKDGQVNGLDVDLFVSAVVTDPFNSYGDMNEDGLVTGLDVDPFVVALLGGNAEPIPEPATLLLCAVALGVVGGLRKRKRAA